jgi:hypothetical protein
MIFGSLTKINKNVSLAHLLFGQFELLFSNFFTIKNYFELSSPLFSTQQKLRILIEHAFFHQKRGPLTG